MPAKKKMCFVISPIGSNDSPQRKWADQCLKYIFKPSLEPLGYNVIRADEISETGSITHQVLGRVTESELVIADLTDHNPNVFYELAVRDTIDRPVIRVIKVGQRIPFDVADLRTISIDLDIEAVENAKAAIVGQATEIENGNVGTTPVRIAGVLKHLESEKSEEKIILLQVIDGMTELKAEIRNIARENAETMAHTFQDIFYSSQHSMRNQQIPRSAAAGLSDQRERELITKYLSNSGITDGNIVRQALTVLPSQIDYEALPPDLAIESAVNEWLMHSAIRRPRVGNDPK
jgi:hypothetical protein